MRAPSRGIEHTAPLPDAAPTIVVATGLEARAVRRAAPQLHVVEAGVSLARVDRAALGDVVISCGIAGTLRADQRTGSVVAPGRVLRPNGEVMECDPELTHKLELAARRLGLEPARGALVTTTTLLSGAQRAVWAQRGYEAVDMETGLIHAKRVACLRVVLDTPDREISAAWLRPWSIIVRPDVWGEIGWVSREAARCARLAATVLAEALA